MTGSSNAVNGRAAIYNGKKNIIMTKLPMPECRDNDILVRNLYASICGTDVAVYLHGPDTWASRYGGRGVRP